MENYYARMVRSASALLLLGLLNPSWVSASGGETLSSKKVTLPGKPGAKEIVSERTANSRTFINPDGTRTKQVTKGYFNYKDADGNWIPLDGSLKAQGNGIYSISETNLPIVINANSGLTSMKLDGVASLQFGDETTINYFDAQGESMGAVAPNASFSSNVNGNNVELVNYYNGINRSQKADYWFVETDYVIQSAAAINSAASQLVLTDEIELPSGYSIQTITGKTNATNYSGDLYVVNSLGQKVAVLKAPLYYDNSNTKSTTAFQAGAYNLSASANGAQVGVVVDVAWLNNPNVVYPVTIDPIIANTYSAGDIPGDGSSFNAACNNNSLPITFGGVVNSVDASWSIISQGGGWQSEQRSRIHCVETGNTTNTFQGSGFGGTFNYASTGLTIANGACSQATFEMQYHRTWPFGSACGTQYGYVINNTWTMTIDYTASNDDIGVTSIDIPAGGACGFAGPSILTATVENFGANPASGFDIYYVVNGTVVGPQAFTGTLAPGASQAVSLTTPANFTQPGTYFVDAYTVYSLDIACNANDTAHNIVNNVQLSAPFTETLDTLPNGYAVPFSNGWVGNQTGFRWNVGQGSTPTGNTGPSSDYTGGGKYFFTEADAGDPGDTAVLVSPTINITGIPNLGVSFFYHKYGVTVGDLYVDVFNCLSGQWITNVAVITGETHFAGTDSWTKQIIPLNGFAGTIKVRFRGVKGWNNVGDMAIDEVFVGTIPAIEANLVSIDGPSSACALTANENVSITITNQGANALSNISASYVINGGTPVTEVIPGPIAAGAQFQYTFTTPADLSTGLAFDIDAYINVAGDVLTTNDSLMGGYSITNGLFPSPIEDFEANANGWFATLNNGWTNQSSSTPRWQIDNSNTSSGNTGPNFDHTTGTTAGKYIYFETSGGSLGSTNSFTSPCINASAINQPALVFWYHMYGATTGTLSVDVYSNGAWINDIWSLSGQQQTSSNDAWLSDTVSLAMFSGEIQVRFRGTRGSSFTGDMALDDIGLIENYAFTQTDLQATSIDAPVQGGCSLGNETVMASFTNLSTNDLTNVQLTYVVDTNGALYATATDVVPFIAAGSNYQHTFSVPVNMSNYNTYDFTVYAASQANDVDALNDTVSGYSINYTQGTTLVAPFLETFDGMTNDPTFGTLPATLSNGWERDPQVFTSSNPWVVFSGTTGSFGTGPSGDHTTGSGKYVYTEGSSQTAGSVSTLTTPCIDMSAVTNPYLVFWYHKFGGSTMGDFYIDVFDSQWNNVGSIMGVTHTSETDPWKKYEADLTPWQGQTVRIRFRAIANGGCCDGDGAIDDVEIIDKLDYDLRLVAAGGAGAYALTPLNQATAVGVEATVLNNGQQDVTGVTLNVMDGAGLMGASTPANLASAVDTQIVATVAPTAVGTYTLDAYVSMNETDQFTANDSLEDVFTFTVSDTVYAREAGNLPTQIGFNTQGGGLFLGTMYEIVNPDTMTSVTFYLKQPSFQDTLVITLHSFVNGQPDQLLATVDTFVIPTNVPSWYTVPFACGAKVLNSGEYFIAIEQLNGFAGVGTSDEFFVPGASLYNGGTGWLTFESAGLNVAPAIRMNLGTVDPASIVQFDATASAPFCAGETVTLSATSGFASYAWNGGTTGADLDVTTDGAYTVVATAANGCTYSSTVNAVFNALPAVSLGNDTTVCAGDAVIVTPGTGYSAYSWSNGGTNPTINVGVGTWTVTVTDANGCMNSDDRTIAEFPAIPFSGLGADTSVCDLAGTTGINSPSLVLDASSGLYNYVWQDGSTNQYFNVFVSGTYSVTIADANGCETSDEINVEVAGKCVGVEEVLNANTVAIYPNPTQNRFTLGITGETTNELTVEVINAQGQVVYANVINGVHGNFVTEIDLSKFAVGVYQVKLASEQGVYTERILKF